MDRDEVQSRSAPTREAAPLVHYLNRLREQRHDLMARYHIASLGIFGSFSRNEQREGSDLDILVSFTETPSLFSLVDLQDELTELLGVSIDLVLRSELKPHIGKRVLGEVVEV